MACQGHSQVVGSANAGPQQVPLPPHPHGHPVELNKDDTDSLAAESDEGRTCSEAGVEGVHEELLVDDEVPPVRPSAFVTREGFAQLDEWDLVELFKQRGCLLRSVPRFLWGSFRICLKITLEEIVAGASRRNVLQQKRGWKLFLLLPRMMLHRAPRGGAGHWHEIVAVTRRHRRRGCPNTIEKRVARAQRLVQVGELSTGRHALEGADLAPGNIATLRELNQRPSAPRHPIPPLPDQRPVFNLKEKVFCRKLRSARKGAAGRPSGMTNDHLRPLLDSMMDTRSLFKVAELLS